jgi:AcrR family transcriptional regulator
VAQYLKEDVRRRLTGAALGEFAAKGYDGATVATIANRAGVSTGNVYRYFPDKAALFDAVVPARLVARFRALLSERLEAAEGVEGVGALSRDHPWRTAADRLLDFVVEHRLELVIILGRAEGTRYEGLWKAVVDELVEAARTHAPALAERAARSPAVAFGLYRIYGNFVNTLVRILERFVNTLVRILERFEDGAEIREATAAFERYHLAGLSALME